tara:strand:- start:1465 stop:1827 length:363 start_codon:yes stop_codon:yes gene_type:complete
MANFKSAILTTGNYTGTSTSAVELIAPVDVSNEDRISFQFVNTDSGNDDTVQVYGRLATTSGTLASADEWTQIGDDITVSGSSSSLKSIATTGLNWCGVMINPEATHAVNESTWAMLRQA